MNVEEIPAKLMEGLDSLRLGFADVRTQLLARRVLLDLRNDGLRGAVVGQAGEAIAVPLPSGTCHQGQPREIEAIGDLIGDLFLELGLAGAKLGACLPLQASRWTVVRWPQALMPENGRTELRLRAPDLGFPWPLSDVYLEVEPLPGTPARSLVVASPRQLVDSWVEVFDLAGVQLQRLLPAQACEWALLMGLGPKPAPEEELWLLEIQRSRSRLWLVADGRPVADWSLPGNRGSSGLDPQLAEALQRCRRFWRQRSDGPASQRWLVYGAEDRLEPAEADLRQMLPAGALQRWQPPGLGADPDLRLAGLKLCMGWP
jgi:hypothetical protein